MSGNRDQFIVACRIIMLLALIGGIYFRLKGLGKSPFAIDEYYLAASVRNILKHGVPRFDCGGYYVRGLLLQYVAVPFFKYGMHDEFYFRLVTVFSNLLTIPGLYLLAKRLSGRTTACVVVILFCLSIWETEFARFARMYAPFQMLFVWYVYFLYNVIIRNDTSSEKWMYLISFVSIFVYEGAVFLVLMNFLPFIVNHKKPTLVECIASIGILLAAAVFFATDFRHWGLEHYAPSDLQAQPATGSTLPIEKPVLLITTLTANSTWIWAFLSILALSGIAIWRLFAQPQSTQKVGLTAPQAVLLSLAIVLSLLNLYGLLILLSLLAIILSLLDWFTLRQIRMRSLTLPLAAIGVTFIFWLCYGTFTDTWQALIQTDRTSLTEKLAIILFKYSAAVYSKIISLWYMTMPVVTIATVLLILIGLWESAFRHYKERNGYLLLILILLGLAIVEAVLKEPEYSTRYTFFLYPIVLLVIAVSFKRVALAIGRTRKAYAISLGGLILVFMVLSEDFGIAHLWNIDSDKVTYRLGYDWRKYLQYYPRLDFRTPAEIINKNLHTGDIVIATTYGTPYYLQQLDYFYINSQSGKFWRVVGCKGKREIWANAKLIHEPEALLGLLQNPGSTVWLVLRTGREKERWEELKRIRRIFSRYRVLQSVDGKLDLYRIPPKTVRPDRPPVSLLSGRPASSL